MKKELSEAAHWFLRDLQNILDDFAKETKTEIVILNKNGDFVVDFSPQQKICQLIWDGGGKLRCFDHFKMAYNIIKELKKPLFTECYAGFASIWIPILIGDSFLGVIVNCGGIKKEINNKKNLEEKFSKIVTELEILDKKFFIDTILESLTVNKDNLENRLTKLNKLIEILKTHTLTPLKEIFG